MKRLLFDTNVVLDVLLQREPWVTDAAAIWRASDEGRITGCLVASTLTDIFYIARKLKGLETARDAVRVCLEAFEICAVDRQALEQAAAFPGNDFEDNLQLACAALAGLEGIITRDKEGFRAALIPIFAPAEFLTTLSQSQEKKT
jgi:predicted nucleic acid-binding protein